VRFAADLERWGDAVALVADDGAAISYAELARRADAFAAGLTPGVGLLAVEAAATPESITAYLGALRSGVPVLMYAPGPATEALLESLRPDAIHGPSEDGDWRLRLSPQAGATPPHPDLALLLSTSGSTGSPKLVRLSGANLQAKAGSIAQFLGLTAAERAITSLPLSFSYGLSVLNSHLSVGASLVLTDHSVADPAFFEAIARHGVTSLAGVPYSYDLLERAGALARLPGTLKTLTQAGGRMAPEMIRKVGRAVDRIGARLVVMYGQTEATARIAYLPPKLVDTHAGCIGRAIPGGELWLAREDGTPAAPGEAGELVYRGPNVMMGYATGRDELGDPPGPDTLRTGDLAVEEEPGLFRITGRLSRFVKPYGLRVGLDDLEARCRAQGADAHVAGDDSLIVAATATEAARDAARIAVSGLKLPPDIFEFVIAQPTPTLPNGKIDYGAILAKGREARVGASAGQAGMAGVEAFLGRLAGRPADAADSFDALGGDSLSYVQFSMIVEEALGFLPQGWESLSLGELQALARTAPAAKGKRRGSTLESDVVLRCLAITLIVCQHAISGMQGGADVLMMLAGFSWARFQKVRLTGGKGWQVLRDFVTRYVVLYVGIMAVAFVAYRHVMWLHLLFVSTFFHDWGKSLNVYWFMETLTWISVVVCALFAVPKVREAFRARPVASALGLVAAALAVRLVGAALIEPSANAYRTPDQLLLYFAVGWAVAETRGAVRFALFALLCAVSALAWGWRDTHVAAMSVAALTLTFVPRIWLPTWLARTVTMIAAASFYIYLLNVFPHTLVEQGLHAKWGKYAWLEISLSLALGVAGYLTAARVQVWAEGWRNRRQAVAAA